MNSPPVTRPILNLADVDLQARPAAFAATGEAAERYDARMGMVGAKIGARLLGYNLTALPPGKAGFPRHSHRVNEEMFYVIAGTGEVRIGDQVHAIRAGDVIACPPGGADSAHQIRNTGEGELQYLAVSTKLWPEICEYPDSGKFGVMAELGSDDNGYPKMFRHIGRTEDARDYWEGE